MAFTLPPLKYGKVIGRFLAIIGDGADSDTFPDATPLSGTITFAASPKRIQVPSATPDPATVVPQPIVAQLDANGYLSYNGVQGVWLVATDDTADNPTGFTYTVTFSLSIPGSSAVTIDSFPLAVPASTTDPSTWTDLTKAAPVAASNGTPILQGPAVNLTIGTVTSGPTAAATLTGTAPNQVLNLVLPNSGGTGTVKSINVTLLPDGSGNVTIAPSDIGAATIAAVTSAASAASAAQSTANSANTLAASKYTVPSGGIPAGDMTAAVQGELSQASTSVQQSSPLVYFRRYSSGAWPVRGTVPVGSSVEWVGPSAPPIDSTYALAGVDTYLVTVS